MNKIFKLFILLSFTYNIGNTQSVTFPIVIIGGGAGGTAAALQAARLGARVLLIEETPWLGGMLTAAGGSSVESTEMLSGGIWKEFKEAVYHHYSKQHIIPGLINSQRFEPKVGDSILKAFVNKEKNITVSYKSTLYKVYKTNEQITSIDYINTNAEKIHVTGNIFIDASENGLLIEKAKDDYVYLNNANVIDVTSVDEPNSRINSAITWVSILKDYKKPALINKPKNYHASTYNCCCKDAPCDEQKMSLDKIDLWNTNKLPNGSFIINWPYIDNNNYMANEINLNNKKKLAMHAKIKQQTLGLVYFIQNELHLSNIGIDSNAFDTEDKLAYIPYRLDSRRILGWQQLTMPNILKPYDYDLFKYSIAIGDCPLNSNNAILKNIPNTKWPFIPAYGIPIGSLQSKKITNLLACDKNISVSNMVNYTTNNQATCMSTGQAVGALAMAILSSTRHSSKGGIVRYVQNVLLKTNSFIFPTNDISSNHPYFKIIQKTLVNGIIEGVPEATALSCKMYFKPDTTMQYTELLRGLHRITKHLPAIKMSDTQSNEKVSIENFAWLLNLTGEAIFASLWKEKTIMQILHDFDTQFKLGVTTITKPLTRLQVAILIDGYLRPFDFEITE